MRELFAREQLRARRPPGARRPACATRSRIRTPTSTATSSARSTCSRAAATTASSTWCMPRPARSTAPTPRCRSRCTSNVDHPLSLYAATKKANELMAHTYSSLFGLPTTGLRFFTVYGPWGRPDMALFLFTREHPRGQADRRLQPRPPPARLHLRRRHRRGRRRARSTASRAPDPGWNSDAPGSGDELRAVPALQHRQQPAGAS